MVGRHALHVCLHMRTLVFITYGIICKHILNLDMSKKNRMLTLDEEHIEAIEKLNERPSGFNLSKYVRKSLEEDYPDEFE